MWADAFRSIPVCSGVCEVYDELRAKGVEFPMQDLDSMAPILTPQRSVLTTHVEPAHAAVPAMQPVRVLSLRSTCSYHMRYDAMWCSDAAITCGARADLAHT